MGGSGGSGIGNTIHHLDESASPLFDVSYDRKPIKPLHSKFGVSVCSVRGARGHMEDEFLVSPDFAAVFDGHGGSAVSRYLRQNLYGFMQSALPHAIATGTTSAVTWSHNQNRTSAADAEAKGSTDPNALAGLGPVKSPSQLQETLTTNATSAASSNKPPTVEDYVTALMAAYASVDRQVQRISHWSFTGSTSCGVWLVDGSSDAGRDSEEDGENGGGGDSASPKIRHYYITANVGDSRAVLSRNGTAIDLSRDHKPCDPKERERIEGVGGSVVWHGHVDPDGVPIPGAGLYRVNGNLAMSRAIGDRSERPAVSAAPEISVVPAGGADHDDFLVIATDGLWDVMDSNDVCAYVHALLELERDGEDIERDDVALMLVEEALRRGSDDNITIVVVWLNGSGSDNNKNDEGGGAAEDPVTSDRQ